MNRNRESAENTKLAAILKPVWCDLWRDRVGIALLFPTFLALLLWIKPSARSYDLFYTALIVVSTLVPLIYLIVALLQGKGAHSEDNLLDSGMIRFDLVDDRNLIPLAVLCITLVAAGATLLQIPGLRASIENPLLFAPSRWLMALVTSAATTMVCHMGLVMVGFV